MLNDDKKNNHLAKKLIIFFTFCLIVILIAIYIFYLKYDDFRDNIDINVLHKQIDCSQLSTINITEQIDYVFAYMDNIGVVSNKNVYLYNTDGIEQKISDIDVQNPLISINDRYLVMAEENIIYIFENKKLQNTLRLEREIKKIDVNKNGYIGVVLANNLYKSIFELYDNFGKLMFSQYFSNDMISDISISNNEKQVAISSLDSSSTSSNSILNIIDVTKLMENPNSYEMEKIKIEDEIIYDIIYQNSYINILTNTSIYKYENQNLSKIYNLEDSNILYASINLNNSCICISDGFDSSSAKIINTQNDKNYDYDSSNLIKTYTTGISNIALDYGTYINIINKRAMLKKSITYTQDISKIALNDKIAGFVINNELYLMKL